jgi:hypothetical protein
MGFQRRPTDSVNLQLGDISLPIEKKKERLSLTSRLAMRNYLYAPQADDQLI